MRIDGPRGLGSWLQGFFSGSFKGRLVGTTEVEGPVKVIPNDHLLVHGNIFVSGSIARGTNVTASGENSYAGGTGIIATGKNQTVIGRYNIPDDSGSMLFIIGNGTSDESRSNVLTVDGTGELTVKKLKLQETMSLENVEVENLVVSGTIVSPSVNTTNASASIVLANIITASFVTASAIEASDIKTDTFSVSGSLQSPVIIATNNIVAGDVETTELEGPVVKTSQIIVRQYIYGSGSTEPVEVKDRVILDYNSGSGDLEFTFVNT